MSKKNKLRLFFYSNSALLLVERKNILPRAQSIFATPLIAVG